jgi:DNA-binding transcriptional LysR family regulator
MNGRNLDLNDVCLLIKVVEHGNYTSASRVTGIPKSTISQRIAALERSVGTGLLRRTSRSLSLTEAGTLLLPHAQAIDRLAREAERALFDRGEELSGTLRVTASLALSQFALAPVLPAFLDQHSKVIVRLEPANRYVDIVGEGFDLAVRAHSAPLKDSILLQRIVARTPWSLAASPEWVASNEVPKTPDQLSTATTLLFGQWGDNAAWVLHRKGNCEELTVPLAPRLISADMATLLAAAVHSAGITALPDYILSEPVRRGLLLPIMSDWAPPASSISTLSPPRPQSSRLAKAFSDFLSKELRKWTDVDAQSKYGTDAVSS